MTRRLFTAASALSLLVCVALTSLWIASYHGDFGLSLVDDTRPDNATWQDFFVDQGRAGTLATGYDAGMSNVEASETRGKHRRWTFLGRPPILVGYAINDAQSGMVDWAFAGFSTVGRHPGYSVTIIPLWAPVLLTGTLPMVWIARLGRTLRRKRLGLCPTCGYDLRASTERCPECGMPMTSNAGGRPA
ncbi:MAG TPA: hypothetical protein VGI81_27930 [Tepidisphaeraceae bacterium]